MDTKKIIRNITIIFISLSFLLSICLNIYQHQQINKLTQVTISGSLAIDDSTDNGLSGKDDAVQGKGDQASSTGAGGIKTKTDNAVIDELIYQLNAAEEELDYAWKQLSDAQTENNRYTLQFETSLRDSIDDEYGDLFRELDLSPDELESFKDILLDNRIAQRDFYRELYGATPSEEKRLELEQLRQDIEDDEENKIIESLGIGVYEEYKAYKDASDEINEVRSFAASLGSDDRLTETQQKALIEAMRKEPIYSESDSDNAKILFPSEIYTENNIAEILSMHKSYNEAFIKAAQGILSPSQLVLLKGYLNKRHDNYENSLKSMVRRHDRQVTGNSDDENLE